MAPGQRLCAGVMKNYPFMDVAREFFFNVEVDIFAIELRMLYSMTLTFIFKVKQFSCNAFAIKSAGSG